MNNIFYAEHYTDVYIRNHLFPNYDVKGIMLEVGAGPTEFYSMSRHFRNNGWRCVCIEPNPNFVQQHRAEGNEIYEVAVSNEEQEAATFYVNEGYWPDPAIDGISTSGLELRYLDSIKTVREISVKVTTLNKLLSQLDIHNVDFVSVDVEGFELEVMQGFDTVKYQPAVVLLENFLHLDSYTEYMNSIGYSLNNKIAYNYIYTRGI